MKATHRLDEAAFPSGPFLAPFLPPLRTPQSKSRPDHCLRGTDRYKWRHEGKKMKARKPVVGVIGSAHLVEGKFRAQRVGERNLRAVADTAGALPLIFAGSPEITDIGALFDVVDGILLTGARANVHPSHFGEDEDPRYEPYDPERDVLALELIQACVAKGVPLFGICRGLQEMNVAYGGTLHPEIRDLPGRLNHRAPRLPNGEFHPDVAVVFAERHDVRLTPGGVFAKLLGADSIRVNSLHGQGILKLGSRIVIEGVAEDETIEAIRVAEAPAFALGVQWHAEHDAAVNPINRTLFEAFGAAIAQYQKAR
jgi:putative glutamine amidotransferase